MLKLIYIYIYILLIINYNYKVRKGKYVHTIVLAPIFFFWQF